MNEVPRHQSLGRCGPRDVVAEVEERIEEVFEDEAEDVVEPGHEIDAVDAAARRSLCAPHRSLPRFISMAAPRFSAEVFTSRGAKIASGPAEEKDLWDWSALPPRTGENKIHCTQYQQEARTLPFARITKVVR